MTEQRQDMDPNNPNYIDTIEKLNKLNEPIFFAPFLLQ